MRFGVFTPGAAFARTKLRISRRVPLRGVKRSIPLGDGEAKSAAIGVVRLPNFQDSYSCKFYPIPKDISHVFFIFTINNLDESDLICGSFSAIAFTRSKQIQMTDFAIKTIAFTTRLWREAFSGFWQ